LQYDSLITKSVKNILFTFLTLWLKIHPVVNFLTACSKIAWSIGPLCEHRQGDVFSIDWQQYRQGSAPHQSRLYQSLFDFTNIPKLSVRHTTAWQSNLVMDLLLGATDWDRWHFIDVFCSF